MVAGLRSRKRGDVINLPRILIVDDNVDFAFSLGEILKDENYAIECVHTGEEAVETFRQKSFDIVLLDMKLPRISGVEVLIELRRINPEIDVLMMSGHSVSDLLAQAVDGGTHHLFYPPYKFDSVLSALRGIDGEGLVLAVDDAPDLATSIETALTGDGLDVFIAGDRKAAIENLRDNTFDFLVLDLRQAVIHGLEVYWELKKQDITVPTVIVAPCPAENYLTIQKLNQFPLCGYFIKPFDPLDLLPVLETMTR